MKRNLSMKHDVENTCPFTTRIFTRIVAVRVFEQLEKGNLLESVTPFRRFVDAKTPFARKLAYGLDFIPEQRSSEGLQSLMNVPKRARA